MSSVHCVVVWEWQCEGAGGAEGARWLPHAPGVARTLERAHAKQLTRVVLADAEPALRGHSVNLRTLTQSRDCEGEGGGEGAPCRVRRSCYSVTSVAGRGARWEWARLPRALRPQDLVYEPLPMEIQCRLEEAWAAGAESVSFEGWVVCVRRMSARSRSTTAVRAVRRAPQPPYPLTRSAPSARTPVEGRRARIPQQHTGSSVHSIQSAHSAHSVQSTHSAHSAHSTHSAHSPQARRGARSASPRERKPGLARQILHNLNIFSNNNNKPAPVAAADGKRQADWEREKERERERDQLERERDRDRERGTDTECGSTRSGRRHSVDTVSTYLSHESKESLQHSSVGELLNCSAGSDDVFDTLPAPLPATLPAPPPAPLPAPPLPPLPGAADDAPSSDGSIVGVDAASRQVCSWVCAVSHPQWGALCPACLRALGTDAPHAPHAPHAPPPRAPRAPCVALTGCQHMLHLHCLNQQLERLRANGEPLYIECLVCGRVYGRRETAAERAERAEWQAEAEAEREAEAAGAGEGDQPSGSMAWCVQPAPLPAWPDAATILVTYNFQSGRQGAGQPAPGAPYYAVGFPRHSVLPDTPLGRQVLSALRAAWERRRLFTVSASQTTGREHVVAWRVRPPPGARQHYARAPRRYAESALRDALARLHAL